MITEPRETTDPARLLLTTRGRWLVPGLFLVIAGAIQGDGALLTSAYRSQSTVSDDQLSFPWTGITAVTTSLVWGAGQVLIVLGLLAFARSGAPVGRAGRLGARMAVGGAILYLVAHVVSIVGHDAVLDDPVAIVVLSLFGVGTVLTAIGLLLAGAATLRSESWSGWRRYAPIALGAWMVAMIPLQFTAALPLAVGAYAVALIALGVALIEEAIRVQASTSGRL